MIEIRFCKHNLESGSEHILEQLKEKNTNVTISIEACLDNCSICGESPFALIDGDLVQAVSVEELSEKLKELI